VSSVVEMERRRMPRTLAKTKPVAALLSFGVGVIYTGRPGGYVDATYVVERARETKCEAEVVRSQRTSG
jgi:hypothetical protein